MDTVTEEDAWALRQEESAPVKIIQEDIKRNPPLLLPPPTDFESAVTRLQSLDLIVNQPVVKSEHSKLSRMDNILTAILQVFLGCYECNSVDEVISMMDETDDLNPFENLSLNERRILQIQLKSIIHRFQNEYNEENYKPLLELLEFMKNHSGRTHQIVKLDWKSWTFHKFDFDQQQPTLNNLNDHDNNYQYIVLLENPSETISNVISRKICHSCEEDYWDDLLSELNQSQEFLKLIDWTFTNVLQSKSSEIEELVERGLQETLPALKYISEFQNILKPEENSDILSGETETKITQEPQLNFLSQLVKEETHILKSDRYSHQNLLLQLKQLFIESIKEGCNVFYMNQASLQNEQIEKTKLQKEQLQRDLDDSLAEMAKAQEEVKQAATTANSIEKKIEESDKANAQLDAKMIALKCKIALLKFQSELWKCEMTYNVVFNGMPNGVENKDFKSLCEYIINTYDFENNYNDTDDNWLTNENNSTEENKQKLIEILENLHTSPVTVTKKSNRGQVIQEITAKNAVLSKIISQQQQANWTELRIICTGQLFIDANMPKNLFHGKNLSFIANKILLHSSNSEVLEINVSGKDGLPLEKPPKADNGKYQGRDGFDGNDGQAGESAGNVYVRSSEIFNGQLLRIIANGGNGGHGQSGGDGQKGSDGNDGTDGELPTGFLNAVKTYFNNYRIERGCSGKSGGRGGNGGRAGLGGCPGNAGEIAIQCQGGENIFKEEKPGIIGSDGDNGEGAPGGTGGRNGVDHGVVHQGSWCPGFDGRSYGKGKLDKKEYRRWYGFAGYELVYLQTETEVRSSRATNGDKGQNGEKAENREHSRQTPASKSKIDKQDVTSKFFELKAISGESGNNNSELSALRENVHATKNSSNQTAQAKVEFQNQLEKAHQERVSAQNRQDNAEVTSKIYDKNLQIETEQLELEQEALSTILNDRKRVMEVVEVAQKAMQQQSLQQIEQQTRQAVVLKQSDSSQQSPKNVQKPSNSNEFSKGPMFSKEENATGETVLNDFGLSSATLNQIDKHETVMKILVNLNSVGRTILKKATRMVQSMWTSNPDKNKTAIELLNSIEEGEQFMNISNLKHAEIFLKELKEVPDFPPIKQLNQVLENMLDRHAVKWFSNKLHEVNAKINEKELKIAVRRIVTILKGIENASFINVAGTLIEIISDKKFKSKGTEEVVQKVLLVSSGIIKPHFPSSPTNAILEVLKETPLSLELISNLKQILPYLPLSCKDLDEIYMVASSVQLSRCIQNTEDENIYQHLRQLKHTLHTCYSQNFYENIKSNLTQKHKLLDSSVSQKFESFCKRLENPYSHIHLTFSKKVEVYEELLKCEQIEKLEQETFPNSGYKLAEIPFKLQALSKSSNTFSEIKFYRQFLAHCDVIENHFSTTSEQSTLDMTSLKLIFEECEKISLTTELKTSLLVLDGIYQLHSLIILSMYKLLTFEFQDLWQVTENESANILKQIEELSEAIFNLLKNCQSLVRTEEIVHGYNLEIHRLVYGWTFITQYYHNEVFHKEEMQLPTTKHAEKVLNKIFMQIKIIQERCPESKVLLSDLDEIFRSNRTELLHSFNGLQIAELLYDFNRPNEAMRFITTNSCLDEDALKIINAVITLGNEFSASQLVSCDYSCDENKFDITSHENSESWKKLKKYLKENETPERNRTLQIGKIMWSDDSMRHLDVVESSFQDLLKVKQLLINRIVDSYDENSQTMLNVWKNLQGTGPIFGSPVVSFIFGVLTKVSELKQSYRLPKINIVLECRKALASYFKLDDVFPPNIVSSSLDFAEDFSAIKNAMEQFQITALDTTNLPQWASNFLIIILNLLDTLHKDQSEVGNLDYLHKDLITVCHLLQAWKDSPNMPEPIKRILLKIQTAICQISRSAIIDEMEPSEIRKLDKAEMSIWVLESPNQFTSLCSLYTNYYTENVTEAFKFDENARGHAATLIWNTELSQHETSLLQRAMQYSCKIVITTGKNYNSSENKNGMNRFIQLFEPSIFNSEWKGTSSALTPEECRTVKRIKSVTEFSNKELNFQAVWQHLKEILLQQDCINWNKYFLDLLLSVQFKKITSLFTKDIKLSLANISEKTNIVKYQELETLLNKFECDLDVSYADNENLINLAASIEPRTLPDLHAIVKFKAQFNRCLVLCSDRWCFSTWLLGIQTKLEGSKQFSLNSLSDLLNTCAEENHLLLYQLTLSEMSENWIGEIYLRILAGHYCLWAEKFKTSDISTWTFETFIDKFKSALTEKTDSSKQKGINYHQSFLKTMITCLSQECRKSGGFSVPEADYVQSIVQQVSELPNIKPTLLEKLSQVSLSRWSSVLKEVKYLETFAPNFVAIILQFESKIGSKAAHTLIELLKNQVSEQNLGELLQKFCKQEYHFDNEVVNKLISKFKSSENITSEELFLKINEVCSKYTTKMQKLNRNSEELIRIMTGEKKNEGLVELYLTREGKKGKDPSRLQRMVENVKTAYKQNSKLAPEEITKPINEWERKDIYKWVGNLLVSKKRLSLVNRFSNAVGKIKSSFAKTALQLGAKLKAESITKPDVVAEIRNHLPEVVAVCMRALELIKKITLRDTQIIAILLLLDHSRRNRSCLAEVATGEGKTLILAVTVAVKALEGDNIDLITSSSVLAIQALAEVKAFYSLLGISSAVNCDPKSEDENVRKGRYQNSVMYGDLGSFQRDILLTEFFDKRITMGRNADCVVVDEVDSMLLDKGDNILYLSHNIPELKLLSTMLIEIWQAVHAPDVQFGLPHNITQVVRFIKKRMENGAITFPNYLKGFVEGRLNIWVKNAFLAKQIQEKDSYIVTNLDQKGHRVVLIDKDTGVEQTSMHYNGGLHQFMQLKHGEKLSPESLKAVFMSNITYLKRFQGQLMGITGTLGSEMERDLLAQCYSVDFFQIPRFACRRCIEEEGVVLKNEEQWLQKIETSCSSIMESNGSVLIIAENVKMVELISKQLKGAKNIVPTNVYSYSSAFDTDFAQRGEMKPGEIIVATNIAGRGTDIKTSRTLNDTGGLRVILSFLAPNVRIEEQAFGRTSRAGNKGTVQYIIDISATQFAHTGLQTLSSLRHARDDEESIRLNEFRLQSIPRIEMEEKLFQKFTTLLHEVKSILKGSGSRIPNTLLDIHLDNLKNRWALWLDSVGERIQIATVSGNKSDVIIREFEQFSRDTVCTVKAAVGIEGKALFEKGPFEITKLGRIYESQQKFSLSTTYFERVIREEPTYSEIARYYLAACILKKSPESLNERIQAVKHLKIARKIIETKMSTLGASVQVLNIINDKRRKEGEGLVTGGYETQVKNECEIFQVHVAKIGEAIGSTLDTYSVKNIKGVLDDEEAKQILDVLVKIPTIMKNYRISQKVIIDPQKQILKKPKLGSTTEYETFSWPSTFLYCRQYVFNLFEKLLESNTREFSKSQLNEHILTKSKVWNILKAQNLIADETSSNILNVAFGEKNIKKFDSITFGDYELYKNTIRRVLSENNGKEYNVEIFKQLNIEEPCIAWVTEQLEKLSILEKSVKLCANVVHGDLKCNEDSGKLEGLQGSEEIARLYSILASILLDFSKPTCTTIKIQICCNDLPLPDKEESGSDVLWAFLLDTGILKTPQIKFPLSLSNDNKKIKDRFDEIEKGLQSSNELKAVLERFHLGSDDENETKPKAEDVLALIKKSVGGLRTAPCVTVGYVELYEYFSTEVYPPEIQDFRDQYFYHVIIVGEYKWWNYWGPYIVALMGVILIITGVLLEIFTVGLGTYVASVLISEGIGDIAYAIQSGWSGNFSWGDYATYKMISLAISLTTAGIGAWLSRGAQVAQFGGIAGFRLLAAIGTRVLRKVGQAVFFTAADMFLTYILDKVREYSIYLCRDLIAKQVPQMISDRFNELSNTMDALYENTYEVDQPVRLIKEAFSTVLMEAKNGVIGSKIYSKCSEVASNLGGSMGQAAGKLCAAGSNKISSFNLEGINMLSRGGKLKSIMRGINIAVTTGRILKAIMEMVLYAGRVIDKFVQKLKSITRDLRRALNQRQENGDAIRRMDQSSFQEGKKQINDTISVDIVNFITHQIQHSMVQPLIQQRVHQVLRRVGNATLRNSKKIFNSMRRHEGPTTGIERQQRGPPLSSGGDGTVDHNEIEESTEILVLGENKQTLGSMTVADARSRYGDSIQLYTDSEGNTVLNRPSFQNHVAEFGKGKTAGVLELHACAKLLDKTIEIIDDTGELQTDSPDGITRIRGDGGKASTQKGVYTLRLSKDENGNRHFNAVVNGENVEIPQKEGERNTCLYQALQLLRDNDRGVASSGSGQQLIHEVQNLARKSNTLRDNYETYAFEVHLPFDFGGADPRPTDVKGKEYQNRHVISENDFRKIVESKDPVSEMEKYMTKVVNAEQALRTTGRSKNQVLTSRKAHTFFIAEGSDFINAYQQPADKGQNTAGGFQIDRTSSVGFARIDIVRRGNAVVGADGISRKPIVALQYFAPREVISNVEFSDAHDIYYPRHFVNFGDVNTSLNSYIYASDDRDIFRDPSWNEP